MSQFNEELSELVKREFLASKPSEAPFQTFGLCSLILKERKKPEFGTNTGDVPMIEEAKPVLRTIPSFIEAEVWNSSLRSLDHDWDKADTELLLQLYQSTGARWAVISDRLKRPVEQLKARFVKVYNRLLEISGSLNARTLYQPQTDREAREFLEMQFAKDQHTHEQHQRMIRDLLRPRKKKIPQTPSTTGAAAVSSLVRTPEISPADLEKVQALMKALGIAEISTKTLRVQKLHVSILKQLHMFVLLKEAIQERNNALAFKSGLKVKVTANKPVAAKRRKSTTDD